MSIRKFWSQRKYERTGDGWRYQAIVRVKGKQKKATFDTRDEANLWELEIRTGRRGVARLEEEQPTGLTFVELASLWWQQYAEAKLSAATRENRAGFMERELDPVFGHMLCSDITPQHLQQWDTELRSRMSSGMPQRLMIQIFRWGNRHEILTHNPTRRLEAPTARNDSWTYLSFKEREQFLESERGGPDHIMWMIGFFMGLRVGEICALQKSKIDLHRNVLEVDQRLCRTTKEILPGTKGSKPGNIKRRTLPIPEILRPYLIHLVNQASNWLFVNSQDRPMTHDAFKYRFKTALRAAEIREIRIHDMRHTFASHYMMHPGSNLLHLRDWMGHTSIKQTERYSHLNTEVLRASAHFVAGSGVEVLQAVESL